VKSPGGKAATVGVAVALLVVLFLVLQGGDDDDEPTTPPATEQTADGQASNGSASGDSSEPEPQPEPKPEIPTIVVRGGEPVGGVAELTFDKGDRIRFAVTSDVADHVHLHGYDVFEDIEAGGRVMFDVPATIDGVFEVELEDRVVPLAEITVNPG
jgi:hypothetical protein